MTDRSSGPENRADEVLALFSRGAEFTKELLRENERLRHELVQINQQQSEAVQSPEQWEKLRRELINRISSLEIEYATVRERLEQVEDENSHFAERHIEIEEENNNLANLYVASYQLHSTLDLDEVLKIVIEIVINLIGAEVFAVYLADERQRDLGVVAAEGVDISELPRMATDVGAMGEALRTEQTVFAPDLAASGDPTQPIVVVPLTVQGAVMGAISIFRLLEQKEGFSVLDRELFALLGGHAATAIFAARLYSQSERKLNTIQGFIELLTD